MIPVPTSHGHATRRVLGALTLSAFLAVAALPAGVAETTVLDLTIQNPHSADFDADTGGWGASFVPPPPPRPLPTNPSWASGPVGPARAPVAATWAWGAPTSGPGVAASGSNVWATNLAGNYSASECSGILSAPITIPSGSTASFAFKQWRHFERSTSTSTIFDGGRLFVTADGGATLLNVTAPTPAYDTGTLSSTAATCFGFGATTGSGAYAGPPGSTPPAPTYSTISGSLNAYAGQTVRVVLAFGADSSVHRAGWYIDDFAVTIDGVTTTEDFEASDGGFSVVGIKVGGPGVAYSGTNVWATNLNGDYNNGECAAILSPPIAIPSDATASVSFWQWRHMERTTSSSTLTDAGRLFVTLDGGESLIDAIPTPAYDSGSLLTSVATCFNGMATSSGGYGGPPGAIAPPPVYSAVSTDVSGYAGNTIQFVIAFGSSTSTTRGGWYIDDFTVTVNGTSTVEDFESDDGGFTVVSTAVPPAQPKGWSHGVPTTGPGGLDPSDALWATNLNGNHGPNECHWIESPVITFDPLPPEAAEAATVTLSWQQWFRSGSSTAAGVVQIGTSAGYTIIEPASGYPASPTSTVLDACLGHLGAGLGAFAGTIDPVGGPMTEFEADITSYLGQPITVRFLFASTSSTSTNPGWYVDDVNVEVSVVVTAPDVEDLPIPGVGGTNALGWTSGGPVNTWAFGVTTTNPANETTYKTNLNGNHDLNECSFIESPAVPGALVAGNPTLVFEHWHRIAGTAVNVPWVAGIVLVSGDGGTTWSHLAMPDYIRPVYQSPSYTEVFDDCLAAWGADIAGGAYGDDSKDWASATGGWYNSTGDLSALAGSPSVKVRFAIGSDGTFAYEGWAIRSVTIGGLKVL